MISGGLGALVVVSALKAPGTAPSEALPEARPMGQALLQLRAGAAAANGVDLDAQLRGKCKTNCKQDKEISKLKAGSGQGVKEFDRIVMVAKEIDEILDKNNKLLQDSTTRLTSAILVNKKDWESVNEDLRFRIGEYKDGHALKFADGNKQVDKTMQAVAAFFAHMRKKFVEMSDLIQFNKANVEDYLKAESQKSNKEVAKLGNAVADMRLTLQDLMGQTKGALTQKIKENAAYGVGRVNAADESVAASVQKIEAKVDSDRNENKNAKRSLKDLYREMERVNKNAIKLAKKEEKSAAKQMTKEQADLQDHLKDVKNEARDYYSELNGLHRDIAGDIKMDLKEMAQNNIDDNHMMGQDMFDKSEISADNIKMNMKDIYDELIDKGLNAENVLQAVTYLADYGQDELRKLAAAQFEMQQDDTDTMRNMTSLWGSEYNDQLAKTNGENEALLAKVRANIATLDAKNTKATDNLTSALNTIAEKTDFTSQEFDNAFNNMKAKSVKRFEDNTEWANEYADSLAMFGITSDALNEGMTQQIADTSKFEREQASAAERMASSYSNQLKAGIIGQHDKLKSENNKLHRQMEEENKASKAKFLADLGGVQEGADASMGDQANQLSGFSTKYQASQAEFSKKMEMNSAAEAKQAAEVADMDQDALRTSEEISNAQDKFERNMQKKKVDGSVHLTQRLKATEESLDGMLDASRAKQERAVNSAVAGWKANSKQEENELRTLESHMIGSVGGFKNSADRADTSLRNLDREAGELSSQVNADFSAARGALQNEQARAGDAIEKLQASMEERADALAKLSEDQISKMSKEHQDAFRDAIAERDRKIQNAMIDGETVNEAMLKQIQAAEAEFEGRLNALEGAALQTTGDVRAMYEHQQKQVQGVEMALDNTHNSERAMTLTLSDDKVAQKKFLEDERDKVIQTIENKLGNLDADLEKKIRENMEDRDAKIQAVLADETLDLEDKQRQIAQLDAEAHEKIKELAGQQVALDQQLMTFETEQGEAGGAIALQLKMLGGVLKDEQMAWLKGVLDSKEELRKITDTLSKEVDHLLKLFESEDGDVAGEVEKAKAAARQKLAAVQTQLAELSAEHGHLADEAIRLADQAMQDVSQENTEVTDEITATETKMANAGEALHASDAETSAEIAAERDARLQALEKEREETTAIIHELLDKISSAASEMSNAAVTSADKQRAFQGKLKQLRSRLEAEAEKAKASFGQMDRTLSAYADLVLRAATLRRDAAKARVQDLEASGRQGADRVTQLQAHQLDLEQAGLQGVAKLAAAARGAAERQAQRGLDRASALEQETADWVGTELHNAHSYIASTNAEVARGLEQQRQTLGELRDRATSRLTAEVKQDAALHRDVAKLGATVATQETDLQRLRDRVEAKLADVEREDDAHAQDADREIAALREEVAASSLLQAPKEPERAQRRFQELEQQVSANEAKTRRYEQENELMRAKLEAAVKKEFATHQYDPADRARVNRVLEGI